MFHEWDNICVILPAILSLPMNKRQGEIIFIKATKSHKYSALFLMHRYNTGKIQPSRAQFDLVNSASCSSVQSSAASQRYTPWALVCQKVHRIICLRREELKQKNMRGWKRREHWNVMGKPRHTRTSHMQTHFHSCIPAKWRPSRSVRFTQGELSVCCSLAAVWKSTWSTWICFN